MRKQYTTAEMIEKLDIGQKAEMIAPVADIVVQRKESGIVVLQDYISSKHTGMPLPLTPVVLNATWVIVNTPITFEQAVAYIRKGKTVTCEYGGKIPVKYDNLDELIHIVEAFDGVWHLEE